MISVVILYCLFVRSFGCLIVVITVNEEKHFNFIRVQWTRGNCMFFGWSHVKSGKIEILFQVVAG